MLARFRYAFRALAKTPVVTLAVICSLGLGIGANTAIFSLMYQIILRSLPVQEPERLVVLNAPGEFKSGRQSTSNGGGMDYIFSYRAFRELEKHKKGVEAVAAFRSFGSNIAYETQTISGRTMLVSGSYFPALRVQPMFGRVLTPEDDVHGAGNPVAVLGYGYWKDRLGGRREVLNQPVRINGNVFTIVGVLPRTFTSTVLGEEPHAFVPLSFKASMTPGWDGRDNYADYWLYLFARLEPGATMQQAEAALNTVYAGIVEDHAKTIRERKAEFIERYKKSRLKLIEGHQGQSTMRTESKAPLYMLMAATALVLLIAMANAANLLLARSAQRRKELAIRASLGASKAELMLQLLTEALVLSVGGCIAGLIVAHWTLFGLITRLGGDDGPAYSIVAQLDWPVLLFSAAVALVMGVLFGLYPAWDATRVHPGETLKDTASHTTGGHGSARVRKLLVAAQVTISAVLLIPTGLFVKSLANLLNVDLGLRTENVITFRVAPELNGYKPEQSRAAFARMEQELAAIPGVRSVTAAMVPLIAGSNWGNSLTVEGYPTGPDADSHSNFNVVGAGFLSKMGIPLIAGREFTDADTKAGAKVAVVNETFAKHFFGGRDPIGRKFAVGWGSKTVPDIEIVGVMKDSKYASVKQKTPNMYQVPWMQQDIGEMAFYVRTALPAAQIVPQIRRVMASIDRDLPLEGLRTLDDQVAQNIRTDRLVLELAAAFAVVATLLAMLGLYGVMAYAVTRRTREFGIRLALGAGAGSIRAMVMRELLFILAGGLALGVPAALALSRWTESQLFGVKWFDAGVLAAAVLSLLAASLMAAYIPARRATKVNPTEALRYE